MRTLLPFFFGLFALIFSGCSQTVYTFPAAYPEAGEGFEMRSSIWSGVLAQMSKYANSIECKEYTVGDISSLVVGNEHLRVPPEEVIDHYKAEMENQGWVGEPTTEGYNGDEYGFAEWINENKTAGVRVEYVAKFIDLVVCVGNP